MRTLVVGDVHGCKDELVQLLRLANADRVILVGDLFTKGPKPVGVYKCIREHSAEAVLGNHDERLISALDGDRPSDDGAHKCIERLNKTGTQWQDWLRGLPLFLDVAGFTVVHAGLHPSGKKKRTSRTTALYRRRWPQERAGNPRWHEVYWGTRRVIFGHDAVGGLIRVEREGKPQIIGLDTGCVYGGALSGYLIEMDEIIQVPAQRAYHSVNR
ncbi:MAG: hypothetical protein ACJAZO_001620 [Myxococcota bacterium]|jgi:hypothetical protein